MTTKYGSRRASCKDYLEYIWIENGAENPQAVAYITDMYAGKHPWYCGMCGIHIFEAATVSEVKEQLFAHLDKVTAA